MTYHDGALYGSTELGGEHGFGLLYKFGLDTGTVTPLYSFEGGAKGQNPTSNLYFLKHRLYGTNFRGGTADRGSIFQLKMRSGKGGGLLYTFQGLSDGGFPGAVIPVNGMLYGTCRGGGAGFGTVFKFDPATKQLSTLYQFTGGNDGGQPQGGVISANGLLYGTTSQNGASNAGTLFSVDPATGAQTTIHTFGGAGDGASPVAALLFAKGLLYGTTQSGGANGFGVVFSIDPTTGEEVVVHSFVGATEGSWAIAQLTYVHGDLYGTTQQGGANDMGTVFKVNAKTGEETTLHTFTGFADGGRSSSSLAFHKGKLYGTTHQGGTNGGGVLFVLTP